MRVRRHEWRFEGVTTVWFEYGDETAPTLVFVHGFRGDHHGLEPIVAFLPGFRVLMPDLPGFGESPSLASLSVESYAAWLRAFVAEHAPGAVVLGHSFGSIIVSHAAAGEGDDALQARAIVLVNPIGEPALEGPKAMLSKVTLGYYRAAAALPERAGRALLGAPPIVRIMSIVMAKTHHRALRRWIHDQHDRYFSLFDSRDAVLDAFQTSITHTVLEVAPRIRVPVLLIAADQDDVTRIAAQHRLHDAFPNARLRVLRGVGHLVHYERPAEAAAFIGEFVTSTAETPA